MAGGRYQDDDDEEYDYDDQDEEEDDEDYESYTCVDVDNYNSLSGGELRSTAPNVNKTSYLDNKSFINQTPTKMMMPNGVSYHDYLSFCEQQPLPQTSLIDDLRASRRGGKAARDVVHFDNIDGKINNNPNQQKKPYVGITAATRFRRAHTLDMIRSTKMPLNVSQGSKSTHQSQQQSQQQTMVKTNEPLSFNLINKNNSSPLQFNNSKLVARF